MLALEIGDPDHRVHAELRARAAESAAQALGDVQPAADQLLEDRGHAQEIPHQYLDALGRTALAAE